MLPVKLVFVHYPKSVLTITHLCTSFVQMAAPALLVFNEDGRAHYECTHWQGFPSILWEVMRDAGYPSPPRYVGEEFHEMGVARCHVHMTHAPHPFPAHWASLELEVVGHRLVDTWEIAAMRALNKFCEKNYAAVTLAPIGLFPAEQPNDPNWLSRVGHTGYLQQNRAAETISMSVKCMNALYCLSTLQAKAMAQIIGSAQTSHEIVNAKNEHIADLDAHIGQLEGQVEERDTLLDERNTDFALLEQQFTAQQVRITSRCWRLSRPSPRPWRRSPRRFRVSQDLTLRLECPCHHFRELTHQ